MKSALGLLGLSVLVGACSGSGDALFDPVGGSNSGATGGAGGSGSGGMSSGGTKSDAGDTQGGTSGTGGKPSGGAGTGGAGGAGGSSGNGGEPSAGDGPGPTDPEVIFVAPSGSDAGDCGLESTTPCKTITRGALRAVTAERDSVYVQAGTYAEVVVLKPGIAIIGGFDTDWRSGDRSQEQHRVRITGGVEEGSKEFVAVWAHDLDAAATLENLLIIGPDATGTKAGSPNGLSSYGIHAVSAKLNLNDVDISAGKGANGAAGADGTDAVSTAATEEMNATAGEDGNATQVTCSAAVSGGGSQGLNSCSASPSTRLMDGGKGGDGGARDLTCGVGNLNYTAQPGKSGDDAAFTSGDSGKGGIPGTGQGPATPSNGACSAAGPGGPGVVANGAGGKAVTGGVLASNFWYGATGGAGATGENGSGGGGGGGGGGCDANYNGNTDARGAGGGGGGAGGCAARGGGGGGGGGGGSFGIFAVGSSIDMNGVTVKLGTAGNGGKGGKGGQGQSGGLGRDGGAHPDAGSAGKGGSGGHGGHGGGGAGGAGGVSIGIALLSSSSLEGEAQTSGGSAGTGGDGGASAPNAVADERDGNPGEKGAAGTTEAKVDCGEGTCT